MTKLTSNEETHQIASINADILMARTLAKAHLGDGTPELENATELARHCQLLCSRSKLSPIQAHRADLAAWLSILAGPREDLARPMSARHDLDDVVFGETKEQPGIGVEIFSLCKKYQELKEQDPAVATDHLAARRRLTEEWANTDEQKTLARRYANLLRDEEFLSSSGAHAGNVLILDPEEKVAPVLSAPLGSQGYEVSVAGDVEAAKELMKQARPDAVMAEMDIPITSGLDFCEALKKDPDTSGIPVVMMSAKRGKAAPRDCLRKGADDFVSKPVDLEILLLKLQHMVASKPAQSGAAKGVTGTLSEMSFTDLVQIISAGGRSVIIKLARDGQTGEVGVVNGEIVHAEAGDKQGDEAFYALMRWKEGQFTTESCDDHPKRTVQASLMSLLMEGARLEDEASEDPTAE